MNENQNTNEAFENQQEVSKNNTIYTSNYTQKYGGLKTVGRIISFFGWIIFLIALAVTVISIFTMIKHGGLGSVLTLGSASIMSLSITFSGLVMAGMGQSMRAMADNTNNTGEILAIMKKRDMK